MKKKLVGLAVLFIWVTSCNKTPMKGEYERFVGLWRWQKTTWTPTGGPPIYVMEADSQPYLYTIEITKQGEMFWYKDGEQLQKFDLKIEKTGSGCWDESGCNCSITMKHPTLFTSFGYDCSLGYERLGFSDSGFPYDAPGTPEKNNFIRME